MTDFSHFSALIPAAGLSERMGVSKALLHWDESTLFIEKIIREYLKAGCNRMVCVINEHDEPLLLNRAWPENVSFVINHHPEQGRLYSIRAGLGCLNEEAYCFIQNVDNPFIHSGLIDKLMASADPMAWCSPAYIGKGGHPVLLPPAIIREIVRSEDSDASLAAILANYPKITVEAGDDLILRNINSPEDYGRYFPLTD